MTTAALIVLAASALIYLIGWFGRDDLDRHIAEALDDGPDYDANVNARWQG